jgi:hypothetical protein
MLRCEWACMEGSWYTSEAVSFPLTYKPHMKGPVSSTKVLPEVSDNTLHSAAFSSLSLYGTVENAITKDQHTTSKLKDCYRRSFSSPASDTFMPPPNIFSGYCNCVYLQRMRQPELSRHLLQLPDINKAIEVMEWGR